MKGIKRYNLFEKFYGLFFIYISLIINLNFIIETTKNSSLQIENTPMMNQLNKNIYNTTFYQ